VRISSSPMHGLGRRMTVGSVAALLPVGWAGTKATWRDCQSPRRMPSGPNSGKPQTCWRFSKAVAGAYKWGRRIDNPPQVKNLPHNCAKECHGSSTWSALPAQRGAHGRARRPRPGCDLILLAHGAREGHNLHRVRMRIFLAHRPAREACLGNGRYHALLDLGAGPPIRELGQFSEVERGCIHATAEGGEFLKISMRSSPAAGRQKIPRRSVPCESSRRGAGRSGCVAATNSPWAFSCIQVRKNAKNPTLFPAGIGGRDPRLDLVEPKNRGPPYPPSSGTLPRMRLRALPMPARKKKKGKIRGNMFDFFFFCG